MKDSRNGTQNHDHNHEPELDHKEVSAQNATINCVEVDGKDAHSGGQNGVHRNFRTRQKTKSERNDNSATKTNCLEEVGNLSDLKPRRTRKRKGSKPSHPSVDGKNEMLEENEENKPNRSTAENCSNGLKEEPTNGVHPDLEDEALQTESPTGKGRKFGRLSLRRKEEVADVSIVTMLLKPKQEPESGASNGKITNGVVSSEKISSVAPSLVNHGNTCFLNSVLQVLFYTPAFVENIAILNSEINSTEKDLTEVANFESQFDVASLSSRSWRLVRHLNELLQKMKKLETLLEEDRCRFFPPLGSSELLDTIQSLNSLYEREKQQDAHELLQCLLGFVQDAILNLNRCRKRFSDLSGKSIVSGKGHSSESPELLKTVESKTPTCKSISDDADSCLSEQHKNGNAEKNLPGKRGRKPSGKAQNGKPRKKSKLKLENVDVEILTDVAGTATNGAEDQCCTVPKSHRSPVQCLQTKSSAILGNFQSSKSIITGYFGAVLKPRSIDQLVFRDDLVSDFVETMYQGKRKQQMRCLECETVTSCFEDFMDINLPVKSAAKSKLCLNDSDEAEENATEDPDYSWILDVVDEMERLQMENKFWCGDCVQHTEAERWIQYTNCPAVLTFQLKRFAAFNGFFGGFTKTMDCVRIPLSLPCLEHSCRTNENGVAVQHRYNLYAVLSHSGISLSSGHYISYIKPQRDSKSTSCDVTSCQHSTTKENPSENKICSTCPLWLECDDESISRLAQCQLLEMLASSSATTPYLLFYRRT